MRLFAECVSSALYLAGTTSDLGTALTPESGRASSTQQWLRKYLLTIDCLAEGGVIGTWKRGCGWSYRDAECTIQKNESGKIGQGKSKKERHRMHAFIEQ